MSTDFGSELYREQFVADLMRAHLRPRSVENASADADPVDLLRDFEDSGKGVLGLVGIRIPNLVVGTEGLAPRQRNPKTWSVPNMELRDDGRGVLDIEERLPELYVKNESPGEAEAEDTTETPTGIEAFTDAAKGALGLPYRLPKLVYGERPLPERREAPAYHFPGIPFGLNDLGKGALFGEDIEPATTVTLTQGNEFLEVTPLQERVVVADLPEGSLSEIKEPVDWEQPNDRTSIADFISDPAHEDDPLPVDVRQKLASLYVRAAFTHFEPHERILLRHYLGIDEKRGWEVISRTAKRLEPKTLTQLGYVARAHNIDLGDEKLPDYINSLIARLLIHDD